MDFAKLKHLASRIHETTKEHAPTRRKHIAIVLARLAIGIVVFKDKRLGNILRSMFARGH